MLEFHHVYVHLCSINITIRYWCKCVWGGARMCTRQRIVIKAHDPGNEYYSLNNAHGFTPGVWMISWEAELEIATRPPPNFDDFFCSSFFERKPRITPIQIYDDVQEFSIYFKFIYTINRYSVISVFTLGWQFVWMFLFAWDRHLIFHPNNFSTV